MSDLGTQELLLILGILAFAAVFIGFWIWTLVDCIKHEPVDGTNKKVVWVVIIAACGFLGAVAYHFFRRPQRLRDQYYASLKNSVES